MDKQKLLILPIIINTVIFFALSVLHFYWAFGGELWLNEVLPTNTNGTNRLNPSMTAALIVAFGLMFLALITAANQGLFDEYLKRTYFRYCALIISIIFCLRAIGEFKFVGFFKTINATKFAVNDTQIFSPLCLFIAFLSLLIFLFNKHNA